MSDQYDDGQAQPSPTPIPRGQRFSDPQCNVVWAAIRALDEAAKHDLLFRLGEHLALSETDRDGPQATREARAVAALREAWSLHAREGDTSSTGLPVAIYRALRSEHPERSWPPDGSIRRWLGGNWNDALRRAGLDALPEAEVTMRPLGSALSKQEAVAAVQACAKDLGEVPTFSRYVGWVRRPDVRRREGRRPSWSRP
jgi:hypothetical protein